MENYRRLFKDAERLRPGESMWNRIAAGAAGAAEAAEAAGGAKVSGAAASRKSGPSSVSAPASPALASASSPAREDVREARPWRLAASLAVGLGMVAALAVLFREPPGMASREGAEKTAAHQLATADADLAAALEGLQEWHADLGIPAGERFEEASAEGWADDTALSDPLLEE